MILPLREFQLHASKYLPIEEEISLTRYGKTIAHIIPCVENKNKKDILQLKKQVIKTTQEAIEAMKEKNPEWEFCEHGARKDLCGKCL